MQSELLHFIWLFLGLDRADFSQADIDELDQRIKALPSRLQLSCKNRPNLGKVFLELKENKAFMEEIRLKVAYDPVDAKKSSRESPRCQSQKQLKMEPWSF